MEEKGDIFYFIIKNISSNEYLIIIPIIYKILKNNIEYYSNYRLLKLIDKNTWENLVDALKNIK